MTGLPGQCGEIVASDITKNSCKLSWKPPEHDGGTPILHYVVERREASKKTYLPVISAEKETSCMVVDLLFNLQYYFRVKAVNKVGAGEYTETRNPVVIEEQKRE